MAKRYFQVENIKFYALNLLQIQDYENEIESISGAKEGQKRFGKERFIDLLKVFHAATQREGQTVTLEQVGEVVDLDNFGDVAKAVLGMSDLIKKGAPPDAVVPTSPLTGGVSTPA